MRRGLTMLVLAAAMALGAGAATAGELTVMTSVALTPALDELKPKFERGAEVKLAITYGLIADLKKRILAGEIADAVILSQAAMEELAKESKIVAGSLAPVATTEVAVAVRAGTPKPDISTVDAFKKALLAAKSIVYADPAKGGASGVYFARVADRLGVADQLKEKTILVPGAQAAEVVAKGEAELGIGQASEIVPVPGAQLVGPFPGEFANKLRFVGAIGANAKSPDAAKALLNFLAGPDAKSVLASKGFEPG